MSVKEDKELSQMYIRHLQGKIREQREGITVQGVSIDMTCYMCGNEIIPFETDGLAQLCFDPGEPQTRWEPGEPATVYLVCERCIREATL